MARQRSRRLRKKLFVDEFQELGFELSLQYREEESAQSIDAFMTRFAAEAIESRDLIYCGCDEYGLVCLGHRGSVTEAQQAQVEQWLKQQPELAGCSVGALIDAWYPHEPINSSVR